MFIIYRVKLVLFAHGIVQLQIANSAQNIALVKLQVDMLTCLTFGKTTVLDALCIVVFILNWQETNVTNKLHFTCKLLDINDIWQEMSQFVKIIGHVEEWCFSASNVIHLRLRIVRLSVAGRCVIAESHLGWTKLKNLTL